MGFLRRFRYYCGSGSRRGEFTALQLDCGMWTRIGQFLYSSDAGLKVMRRMILRDMGLTTEI
jgi:hypothetical protein